MRIPGSRLERLLFFASVGMILLGILARILGFLYNRALWLDESMLASSLVRLSYGELLLTLDFKQGAPIGYLWIVKSLVYLFGTSEYVLRILSLFSGLGSILLFFMILKNAFGDLRPWVGTAFFATIPFLIDYSLEFKPYMFDGFLSLASVYLFSQTIRNRIKPAWLVGYCGLVIWFSFPAIFVLAGFCLLWFGSALWKGDFRGVKVSMVVGLVTLFSFGIYYLTLFGNLEDNQSGLYWELVRFPLVPRGIEDLKMIAMMARRYLSVFGQTGFAPVVLLSVASIILCKKREMKAYLTAVVIVGLIVLIVSWLGYYGMVARILLFYIPLHVILASLTLQEIQFRWKVPGLAFAFLFVLVNVGSAKLILPQYVYREGYEVNPLISKWQSDGYGIPLYVFTRSTPSFAYKTNYMHDMNEIGSDLVQVDNVIYGSWYFERDMKNPYLLIVHIDHDELNRNAEAITKHEKVWLLMGLTWPGTIEALLKELEKSGSVTELMNKYNTPLYLYQRYPVNDPLF
jgi:hypothetical protein